MPKRKASFNAIARMITLLSDEEQLALVDNPGALKVWTHELLSDQRENEFVRPLSDREAIEILPNLEQHVPRCRQLANEMDFRGKVFWRVKAGCTLKHHVPKLGPCHNDLKYIQNVNFNDEPTQDAVVFWSPRLMPGSVNRNVQEQMELLQETRKRLNLPPYWFSFFGPASLNAALILAEYKQSGKRVPLDRHWARTDSRRSDVHRLSLGDFGEHGLVCDDWDWDDRRGDRIGCFALGVETLGS